MNKYVPTEYERKIVAFMTETGRNYAVRIENLEYELTEAQINKTCYTEIDELVFDNLRTKIRDVYREATDRYEDWISD